MSEVKLDLLYTKDHEWISKPIDGISLIGVTDYAQSQLGDIVYVESDIIGSEIDKDIVFGSIEAVKTVSDLFVPVSGELLEINSDLENSPDLVNSDPYGNGWIVKIKISDISEFDDLLTPEQYTELIEG